MLCVKDGETTEALPLLKELLKYGSAHSEVVILEGIMNDKWYHSLFELAKKLYYIMIMYMFIIWIYHLKKP